MKAGFALLSLSFPFLVSAQTATFDSDAISGLGARNIGAGVISGRVAAITAVRENGRLTVFVGSAGGGVWKSVNLSLIHI